MKTIQEQLAEIQANRIVVEENYGTDVLEQIVADSFALALGVKKLFTGDIFGALSTFTLLVAKYEDVQTIFKTAWVQLKDLDPEEAQAVMNAAKEAFDIEDDELERKIEALFDLPPVTYLEVLETIEVAEKVRDILAKEGSFVEKLRELADLFPEIIEQAGDAIDVVIAWKDGIAALLPEKE